MRVMRFNAHASHVLGKNLVAEDALSRNPLGLDTGRCMSDITTQKLEYDVNLHFHSVQANWQTTDARSMHSCHKALT